MWLNMHQVLNGFKNGLKKSLTCWNLQKPCFLFAQKCPVQLCQPHVFCWATIWVLSDCGSKGFPGWPSVFPELSIYCALSAHVCTWFSFISIITAVVSAHDVLLNQCLDSVAVVLARFLTSLFYKCWLIHCRYWTSMFHFLFSFLLVLKVSILNEWGWY